MSTPYWGPDFDALASFDPDIAGVVLDGGPRAGSGASTIVDCTGPVPRVLRVGAIPVDRLREVVPEVTD